MCTIGHKNIKNTLLYTQQVQADEKEDDFVLKLAKTPQEIQSLIEADLNTSATWMISNSSENESECVSGLFQNDVLVPRAGFEPATTRSSASPSVTKSDWVERSPRLSYLGTHATVFL